MDGLDVQCTNDENRDYVLLRAQCIVNEYLASAEARRELDAKEFEMILRAMKEVI